MGISAIICITADVWTLEQINLVFSIPSFQASVSKQGQCLISGMRSSVTRIIPLSDQQDISACLNKRKNISVLQSRWKSRSFLCMNAPITSSYRKWKSTLILMPCWSDKGLYCVLFEPTEWTKARKWKWVWTFFYKVEHLGEKMGFFPLTAQLCKSYSTTCHQLRARRTLSLFKEVL